MKAYTCTTLFSPFLDLQMAATCRKHETLTDFIISSREKLCHDELFETTCSIPYKVFFQNYLLPNKPCIFSSSLTKNWPCRRDWVCGGAPNFAVLRTLFGRLGKFTLYVVNNECIMLFFHATIDSCSGYLH